MIEWLATKIAEITGLVQSGVVLLAICAVAMVYFRTKQLVATATAALLAGAVIWAVNNIDWFERKVGEEAASSTPAVEVVTADEAAGAGYA